MSGPVAHPIDPDIREAVLHKLRAVEAEHDVRVLYACESGSRGWGFASPDSDYDVRFIFVRPARDYLRVTPVRDVIEETPGPVFDVNGWDVRKALQLLAKGNATLVEWPSSPVVYRQDDGFVQRVRQAAADVYQPVRSFHHYYAMGRGNHREYLQGEQVRAKSTSTCCGRCWRRNGSWRGPMPRRWPSSRWCANSCTSPPCGRTSRRCSRSSAAAGSRNGCLHGRCSTRSSTG